MKKCKFSGLGMCHFIEKNIECNGTHEDREMCPLWNKKITKIIKTNG